MPHSKELTKPRKAAVATKTKVKAAAQNSKNPKNPKNSKNSKKAGQALATCPVNGAGWCPYPFSVEQLERRLKEKAAALAAAEQAKRG